MHRIRGLIMLFLFGSIAGYSATVFFTGPTNVLGDVCTPGDPGCVIGGSEYNIYDVQITQPSALDPLWTVIIETNYVVTIPPGSVIPPAPWGTSPDLYSFPDLIISWNGHDYGLVLAQHIQAGVAIDSYVAGNLYRAPIISPDLLTAGDILPPNQSPRPDFPVFLAPGGLLQGTGSVTVSVGGTLNPAAQYTIMDRFSALPGFLASGPFSIIASSFPCGNGIIVGGGTFDTPEPSTVIMVGFVATFLILVRRWRLREKR